MSDRKDKLHKDNSEIRMGRIVAHDNREELDNKTELHELPEYGNKEHDTVKEIDDALLPKRRGKENEFEYPETDFPETPEQGRHRQVDINIYQQKKTLAQGMMDIALFSANANQLRFILQTPYTYRDGIYYTSLTLVISSLALQALVGLGLIWNGRYNINNESHHRDANRTNNTTVLGIFLILIINVFLSAFGIPTDYFRPDLYNFTSTNARLIEGGNNGTNTTSAITFS